MPSQPQADDIVLYTKENYPLEVSLAHLDAGTLAEIDGEDLRLIVSNDQSQMVLAVDVTINDDAFTIDDIEDITAQSGFLRWALRHPTTLKYYTGGSIAVNYAPFETEA